MRKDEVSQRVADELDRLGVKQTHFSIKPVPSCVEVQVVSGGRKHIVRLRSGIQACELDTELRKLGAFVGECSGTIDIEEALRKIA